MKKILVFVAFALILTACGQGAGKKGAENKTMEMDYNNLEYGVMNMDSYQSKYRGKKCTVKGPHDTQPCKCSGFDAKNWDPAVCRKCGHRAEKHTR